MRPRTRLLALALASACHSDSVGVESLEITDPFAWWLSGAYVQVVPPVRFPSPEADREQVEVWLAAPPGAVVTTVAGGDGVARLRFPPGTRADRIEWLGSGDTRRIVDVRGTWLDDEGACTHHVLRPLDEQPNATLVGIQWPCDQPRANVVASERMRERLVDLPPFNRMDPERTHAALDRFAQQIDCDGCHVESRAQARWVDELGPVWRGTDASGFFAPQSALQDAIPLEGYGAFDLNVDDPAVTVDCGDRLPQPIEVRHGVLRWRCADGRVPQGRIDWAELRRNDAARALAICQWRAWLWARLDSPGRAAFAASMAPC